MNEAICRPMKHLMKAPPAHERQQGITPRSATGAEKPCYKRRAFTEILADIDQALVADVT